MKIGKPLPRDAVFPGVMAGISFAVFLAIYYLLTQRVIQPHYKLGLLFAIPSVCFAAIAVWSKRYPQKESDPMLTGVLTIVLGLAFGLMALIAVPGALVHDAVTDVTDVGSYERVIRRSCFSEDLIADFPDQLPEDAENAKLYYSPFAVGQGGQEIAVGFQANAGTIHAYTEQFSKSASWIGKECDTEASQHGVFAGEFSCLDGSASGLPNDFQVYVISGKPYGTDWNHGENSLVAISEKKSELLFWASKW